MSRLEAGGTSGEDNGVTPDNTSTTVNDPVYDSLRSLFDRVIALNWGIDMQREGLPVDDLPELVEQSENEKFIAERLMGSSTLPRTIGRDVFDIYLRTYPDIIAANYQERANIGIRTSKTIYDALDKMANDLSDPYADFILLREKSGKQVVGMTSAYPEEVVRVPTVAVGATAILESYRRQGGWSLMMESLETGIANTSHYEIMKRYVRTANGYARRVIERYKPGITEKERVLDEAYGSEYALTIDLGKLSLPIRRATGLMT